MDPTPRFQERTASVRLSLSGGRAAYFGPGLDLAPHRNAAATLAISLEAPFSLALLDMETSPTTRAIALIEPNTQHHLVATGAMAFVYLDGLSGDYRRLGEIDLVAAHARLLRTVEARTFDWDVDTLCRLIGVPDRVPGDPRLVRAIKQLDARPQDFERVADLAGLAGLSSSRFQALFSQAVGMPFRRYRLWRRMAAVIRALAKGSSLTEAAFEAGFSSSAHLSSTFREMFGLTPSAFWSQGVEVVVLDEEARQR